MTKPISGDLCNYPVPKVFYELYKRNLTGSLVIEDLEKRRHCVYFSKGIPAKVALGVKLFPLSDILRELKLVKESAIRKSEELKLKSGKLQGEILLEIGALSLGDLLKALREQTIRRLSWLILIERGVFGFYMDENFLKTYGGPEEFPIDPYFIINKSLLENGNIETIRRWTQALVGKYLKLKEEAIKMLARFSFSSDQLPLLKKLKNPQLQFPEILKEIGIDERVGLITTYCLWVFDLLELRDKKGENEIKGIEEIKIIDKPRFQAKKEIDISEIKPNQTIIDEEKKLPKEEEELERLVKEYEAKNLFEVLGVKEDAEDKDIYRAYTELAKKYHPDKITKGDENLKKYYEKIFARINQAYIQLRTREGREEYKRELKEKGDRVEEEKIVSEILTADVHFRKAKILFKTGRIKDAKEEIERAIKLDPNSSLYKGFEAWIIMNSRKISEPIDDLLPLFKKAYEENKKDSEIVYYYGEALKRKGDLLQALKLFEEATSLNPYNEEAKRELVILKRRMEKKEKSGFFKKLLGKK